jgi:hypothetical protein
LISWEDSTGEARTSAVPVNFSPETGPMTGKDLHLYSVNSYPVSGRVQDLHTGAVALNFISSAGAKLLFSGEHGSVALNRLRELSLVCSGG